jgi:D-alanyl-D-alanine dipeptidase
MAKQKTVYVARVKDVGAKPKEGGKAFRVRTSSNRAGQFGTRAWAQEALDAALANDHDLISQGVQTEKIAAGDAIVIDEWLTGNVVPIQDVPTQYRVKYRAMLEAAARVARDYGHVLHVNESFRTLAQQQHFWDVYQHGGAIAAKPGTSNHERGAALDIPNAWTDKKLAKLFKAAGFGTEAGEAWHVHYLR